MAKLRFSALAIAFFDTFSAHDPALFFGILWNSDSFKSSPRLFHIFLEKVLFRKIAGVLMNHFFNLIWVILQHRSVFLKKYLLSFSVLVSNADVSFRQKVGLL